MLSLIVHLLCALAFSTQTMVRTYSKPRRVIQATLGEFFALAEIKLLPSPL